MAITGDPTDPRGTKRLNKNLILESLYIYRLIKVVKYPSKICLSANICFNDVYGIFSLFFNDEVLNIIIKNTNMYGF